MGSDFRSRGKGKTVKKEVYALRKNKLKVLYKQDYKEDISCWKIERVIRKHKLYPNKIKAEKTAGRLPELSGIPKRE